MTCREISFIKVIIQFNSCYCGIALKAIQLPQNCRCLGLVRQEEVILITENPTIYYGDTVLAIAIAKEMTPALEVALKKRHPVLWTSFQSPLKFQEKPLDSQIFLAELCCKD